MKELELTWAASAFIGYTTDPLLPLKLWSGHQVFYELWGVIQEVGEYTLILVFPTLILWLMLVELRLSYKYLLLLHKRTINRVIANGNIYEIEWEKGTSFLSKISIS